MSKVFFSVGMSLDGFIAGPNGGPKMPLGEGGPTIHTWIYRQRAFREQLKLGGGGETGPDNDLLEATIARAGASIMGKQMFVEGEANWPEDAPFHTPVFVLTKEVREPWERKGGTTFYFVHEGLEAVLEKARKAAGGKDVRIAGGASMLMQYVNAGLVDEFHIALAPVFLGAGVRLFDGIDKKRVSVEQTKTIASSGVTHLFYIVESKTARAE